MTVSAKCGDVLDPLNSPANDSGWILDVVVRATLQEGAGPTVTAVDVPVQLPFPTASNGKLSLRVSSDTTSFGILGAGADISACSNLEVIAVKLRDPAGNLFARLGGASHAPL